MEMPAVAVTPLTRTVSFGSSVVSLIGISSKVAVPAVEPAGTVSVRGATAVKSPPATAVPPVIESVTFASASRAAASSVPVTVTVRADVLVAPSDMVAGDTVSVTSVDVSSLSVISSGAISGCSTPRPFTAAPLIPSCRFAWSIWLSLAVIVTEPALVVASAAMVSVVPVCV